MARSLAVISVIAAADMNWAGPAGKSSMVTAIWRSAGGGTGEAIISEMEEMRVKQRNARTNFIKMCLQTQILMAGDCIFFLGWFVGVELGERGRWLSSSCPYEKLGSH